MLTCYRCAKPIKGNAIQYVPPRIALELGADFRKAFHPACYRRENADAAGKLPKVV